MARPRTTDPKKYYLPRHGWRVMISGQCFNLGRDEATAESKRIRLVAAWLAAGGPGAPPPDLRTLDPSPADRLKVGDVAAAYLERGLRPNLDHRQRRRIGRALDAVVDQFGGLPVADFGGPELKAVRKALLATTYRGRLLSRNYVNSLVGCIKTAWGWLVSERLAPSGRLSEILAVSQLEEGDGGEETPDVLPPDPASVDAVLPHLPPAIAAMVRVQRLTGMRPGEVCLMRRCDLSTSPAEVLHPANALPTAAFRAGGSLVWVYAPASHKTRRRGKPRLVALNVECQEILRPFLIDDPDVYLFRPPPHLGMDSPRYTTASYGNAVRRACKRARAKWRPPLVRVELWRPNQLRHAVATDLYVEDPTLAAATLGNTIDMAAHYAAANLKRAGERAARVG